MPDPEDFRFAQEEGWYRVRPRGVKAFHLEGFHFEYMAFYFPQSFGEGVQWSICYYAQLQGHELISRAELRPDQPNHPRADEMYYKLKLGPLKEKDPPIISERRRRITFIGTTWDRFVTARKIEQLTDDSDKRLVDRVYHVLQDRGVKVKHDIEVKGSDDERYTIDMLIPPQDGGIDFSDRKYKSGKGTDETSVIPYRGKLLIDLPPG